MSTRSRIAIQNDNGSFRSIYCHFDGYDEGVGATLRQFYTDPVKINALLDLGDISQLGMDIGKRHSFDDRSNPDWTTAYGRDRNEIDIDAHVSASLDELKHLARGCGAEYLYVFRNGEWVMWERIYDSATTTHGFA